MNSKWPIYCDFSFFTTQKKLLCGRDNCKSFSCILLKFVLHGIDIDAFCINGDRFHKVQAGLDIAHLIFSMFTFLSPARRSYGVASDVRSVVRTSAFCFGGRSQKPVGGFLSFCTHTSPRVCKCAFWVLRNSTYLNG